MIQTCTKEYREMAGFGDKPFCGRTFDDVDHSTICPHDELGTEGLICKHTDLYKSMCPHCKPCCDLHGRNCEPPSELCCERCTEAAHPDHADGSTCSNPDLSRPAP